MNSSNDGSTNTLLSEVPDLAQLPVKLSPDDLEKYVANIAANFNTPLGTNNITKIVMACIMRAYVAGARGVLLEGADFADVVITDQIITAEDPLKFEVKMTTKEAIKTQVTPILDKMALSIDPEVSEYVRLTEKFNNHNFARGFTLAT